MLFNTLANLRVLIATRCATRRADARSSDCLPALPRWPVHATAPGLACEFCLAGRLSGPDADPCMGERLSYGLHLPAELAELPVPTLLLQPLVRTAFAMDWSPTAGRRPLPFTTQSMLDDSRLLLSVHDNGLGLPCCLASRLPAPDPALACSRFANAWPAATAALPAST